MWWPRNCLPLALKSYQKFSKLFIYFKSAVIVFNLEFPSFEDDSKTLGTIKMAKSIVEKFTKAKKGTIILGSFLQQLRNLGHEEKFSKKHL